MADWRVYAFDLNGSGGMTLNDNDVRASVQPSRELNGGGALALALAPEQDVTLKPWKSLIVAELDGSIRGTGIVSTMTDDGSGSLSVTCVGITDYYAAMPADMKRTYRNADPAKIIHEMISWAESRGGTNVGLDLSKYVDSGVRVGNPDPPVIRPIWNRRPPVQRAIPRQPQKKDHRDYYLKGNSSSQVARRKKARDAYDAAIKSWRTARDRIRNEHKAAMTAYNDAKKEYNAALKDYQQALVDAEVKVLWWDNPTIGSIIDEMSKHVDYRLVPRWNGGKPDHTLEVRKKIGARKSSLRFVVGENVIASPSVDWAGESYATRVVFLGAGEGAAKVRAEATGPRDGLARTVFISDTSVRSTSQARQRAQRALKWRQAMPQVTELVVRDDGNAPFGSFDVGDEVRLFDPSGRWAGTVDMWVRIVSITESSDSATAQLSVTRADIGE